MSLGNSAEELMEAIWLLLRDDATLLTLTGAHPDNAAYARVYDEPPTNAALPYVVIGDLVGTPFNTFGKIGREYLVDVHAYSAWKGNQEALQIAARVEALLDFAALTVTGYTVSRIALDDLNTLREAPNLRHAVARFRVHLQEA